MELANGMIITHIPSFEIPEGYRELWVDWIKALRSGEYEQISCCLRKKKPDGAIAYCFLGVAADVAIKKTNDESKLCWAPTSLPNTFSVSADQGKGDGGSAGLGKALRAMFGENSEGHNFLLWEGFYVNVDKTRNPEIANYGVSLLALNDSYGVSFHTLADIIECAIEGGYTTTDPERLKKLI